MRYLRNKKDGFIYEWHPVLANNPLCEEVTEQEAYPERFAPAAVVEKAKRRTKKIDLTTDDIPEEPVYSSPELSADASRDLPE
jgi:hypothetical protein